MKSFSFTDQITKSKNKFISKEYKYEKFKYIKSFDVIRGIAVLLVLLLHASYGFFKGGWVGVDLFFVLSGYLITSLLLNEYLVSGKIIISKFYIRRALRLFPPLIICIIISNILWSFTTLYPGANEKEATLGALFYFTNIIPGNVAGNMAHLWSLAVEEHFYLFWPVLASILLFRISLKNRIVLLVILIITVSLFRVYAYNHYLQFANGAIIIDPYFFTFCRIDNILLGSVLSFLSIQSKFKNVTIKNKTATFLLVVFFCIFGIIVLTISKSNIFWSNGGFIGTNIACVLLVLVAGKKPDHFLLKNRILRWIGIRSYGIYVYHFPIFLALEGLRKHHSTGNFLLITVLRFGITLLLAEISYRYIEMPVLKIKKRYEVSKVGDTL